MAQNSKIEWCDHTANLWHGCTKVHAGCDNCYAEQLNHRWGKSNWGNETPRLEIKSVWNDLAKYQKLAQESGEIHRVFVGSMMDIFEKPMPVVDGNGDDIYYENTGLIRDKFFYQIIPNSPNLLFLLLTKRPGNINKYIPDEWLKTPPQNVMFGTSVSNQATADMLIPQLLKVKGKRFLSIEPQLERIWLGNNLENIHWVIQGGESGPKKRPFDIEWADDMRVQCLHLDIPYFFKQIDKIRDIPEEFMVREFPR